MKKTEDMNTSLQRRGGGVYYARKKTPADIVILNKHGKRQFEVVRSLGTKDKREALKRLPVELVKINEFFERHRRGEEERRATISDQEMDHIVALAMQARLELDEENRINGVAPQSVEALTCWLEQSDSFNKAAISRGDFSGWIGQIEDWLTGHGFDIPRDSPLFRKFAYKFATAQWKANEGIKARQRGEPVETPNVQPFVQANGSRAGMVGDTLMELLEYWKSQVPRKPKTLHEFTTAVNRFVALHGKGAAKDITRRQVVLFKDHLLIEKNLSPGTVKKQLGALSAILQLAVDNDKIPFNPARGVKIVRLKVEKKARVAFDAEDLKRIFASPLFTEGDRPAGGAGEAAYWMPIIAALHGARLEEIGQLRATDVKTEAGIMYFRISNDVEGTSVKTTSSRRRVPVHPLLLRLGFADYVKAMGESNDRRLFPKLNADRMGILTGNWSKWWGRYMRTTIGIADPRKTFHSFRHTFKDACREAGINPELHDALTGHAPNANEGRSYGGEDYPLKPLAESISQVRIAGIDALLKTRKRGNEGEAT